MPGSLNLHQVDQYRRDGVLFPIDVMSADQAAEFMASVNQLEADLGGRPKPTETSQVHQHFDWAYELVNHARVLDAVESVLGRNIIAWSAGLFTKYARDDAFISWHQDGTYWNLDSTNVTTAWIALTDSVPENGCMRVVRGSHRDGIHEHRDTFADNNALSRGQEIQVEVSEEDATDVILSAGQMSLHDVRIIHGSNANGSDQKRCGFVIRYVTPEVSQAGSRPTGVLARGEDHCGNFELVGPPSHAGNEAALAAQRESARKQLASVMIDARPKD